MKHTKRVLSLVLALCFVLCAAGAPAYAQNRAVTPVGKAYEDLLENGYPTMSTADFFNYVEQVDALVFLMTGRHFVAQEKFNVVLDDTLDELCFSVAQASGLDAALILQNIPEFNGLAVNVNEKYDIDIPAVQKALNDLSATYGSQGNQTLANLLRFVSVYIGIIDEFYLFCVPVEGMEDTYEIRCQLTYRDGRKDYLSSGVYYNTRTRMLYGRDNNGMVGIGYDFDVGNVMVITPVYVWMRNFGFCFFYDLFCYLTPFFNYQTARIKFEYDDAEWMIQLWKGRYIIANGAEIGVYKRELGSVGTFYDCVGDEDMLKISLDLYHNDDLLVHREPMLHWWMTGFTAGKTVYLPQSMRLESDITFKDSEMVSAFCGGIENRNFHDIAYNINGLTVSIEW